MRMDTLLLFLYTLGTFAALLTGQVPAAGNAVLSGAEDVVPFCLSLAGGICFWSAVMELLERCGVARRLSGLLHRPLAHLFPHAARETSVMNALTENITANLLGLGNAATPAGIRAARGLAKLGDSARDELCLLVVLNTASLQLLPTTIAALRATAGASAAFDILPAVWFSTACSLAAVLLAAALFRRVWP